MSQDPCQSESAISVPELILEMMDLKDIGLFLKYVIPNKSLTLVFNHLTYDYYLWEVLSTLSIINFDVTIHEV